MNFLRPKLLEATNAESRMDALCKFIEFWLGPRDPSYGESAEVLAQKDLPQPLRKLYQFAGRWPNWSSNALSDFGVPAFSKQDALVPLHMVKNESDGKVVFLWENQGVWDCRTLATGEDPPVWCFGDHMERNGDWYNGEKLVCDSLSRFLATFVLQEITFGSRLQLCDDGLKSLFESQSDIAIPVWTNGPYVHGTNYDFFLWGRILVGKFMGYYHLSANDEEGIAFLTENQGPISTIGLLVGRPWSLDIESDGSARVRFLQTKTDESADAPSGTFDFQAQVENLTSAISEKGGFEKNPLVFFRRKGQSGGVDCKNLPNLTLVKCLFLRAIENAIKGNRNLEHKFATQWPASDDPMPW